MDNPLLPVVRELAEELVRLKSGRLFAKSSTNGPRDLNDLRVLLLAAGAPAAWWIVERLRDDYNDALDELDADGEEEDTRIEDIKEALLQREPVWRMLKAVQHILYGDEVPTPKPPRVDDIDDDIPF